MKKWISTAAVGVALTVASSAAMAADGQFFINGEAGGSDVSISNLQNRDQTSAAGALRLGYLWNVNPVTWGVEAGYVDLGSINGNNNYAVRNLGGPYDPIHVHIKTRGEIVGGNFKLHYGDYGWFMSARGGFFRSQVDGRANDQLGYASSSSSSSGNGFYAGLGFGYDFNRNMGVSLNYDFLRSKANGIYDGNFNNGMYGATFEYRF